jgi:hypothetical protein
MKLLEENLVGILQDIVMDKDFLDKTPKAKKDKQDYVKQKKLFTQRTQ